MNSTNYLKKYAFVLLLSIVLGGCASSNLMRTWTSSEEYDHDFKNIMVMGLINNVSVRSDMERAVVFAARKIELAASPGISMFPPELGKPFEDIERVKTRLRDKGFDGILTVALIDIKAERYIEPDLEYQPKVYYDRFRNYYYRTYELVYRPGYFSQSSKYFIESNFYELKSGKLVWSGRSDVLEHAEVEDYMPIYGKNLFKELLGEKIITK